MESSFTAHHQTWCNDVQHRRDRHRHSFGRNSLKFVKDTPCEHKPTTKTRAPVAFYCTFVNATNMHWALWGARIYDVLRTGNHMGVLQSRGHTMENLGFFYIGDFPQHVFSKVPPLWKKASCSGGETEGLRVRKAWVWTPLSSDVSLYPSLPSPHSLRLHKSHANTTASRLIQNCSLISANIHVPVKRTLKGRVTFNNSPTHSSTNNFVLVTPQKSLEKA